jgi:peptidylprolyl isomerase
MAAKKGDTVKVHYKGTLNDGTVFDSSEGREPIEFEVGAGQVIPGFEDAVSGLEVGQSKTVTIPASEAYGEHDEAGVTKIPVDKFPEKPEVGYMVELSAPDGSRRPATITEVDDEFATLDLNHPLAGQDLTFEITLVEVVAA